MIRLASLLQSGVLPVSPWYLTSHARYAAIGSQTQYFTLPWSFTDPVKTRTASDRTGNQSFTGCPTPCLPLQDLETRNAELEQQLRAMESNLEEARAERERARAEVGRAAQLLDVRLFELSELREGLARLAEAAP